MMSNQTSKACLVLLMIGMSVGSWYSTSQGFLLYLSGAPWSVVLAISAGVQLAVFFTSLWMFDPSQHVFFRVLSAVMFMIGLFLSSTGSFLYIDDSFVGMERSVVSSRAYCVAADEYAHAAFTTIEGRATAIATTRTRLAKSLEHEVNVGALSKRGAGVGPMYRALESSAATIDSLDAFYRGASARIASDCSTLGLREAVTASPCIRAVACVELELAKLPAVDQVAGEIGAAYDLLRRAQYAEHANAPLVREFEMPTPAWESPTGGSLIERINGAYRDLRSGAASALLAFLLAMAIDIGILMLGALRSMISVVETTAIPRGDLERAFSSTGVALESRPARLLDGRTVQ